MTESARCRDWVRMEVLDWRVALREERAESSDCRVEAAARREWD
jgi:hypothetical protein